MASLKKLLTALALAVGAVAQANAADGDVDTTFGDSGAATLPDDGRTSGALAVEVLPDGRIIAAGYIADDAFTLQNQDVVLARFLPNGTLDTSFGMDGIVRTDFGGGPETARDLALAPGGRLLIADAFFGPNAVGKGFGVARYLPSGELDSTFGSGGLVIEDMGDQESVEAIIQQPDDRIIVAGSRAVPGGRRADGDFALLRLLPDGSVDQSFGVLGKAGADFAGFADQVYDLALLPDGEILAAGTAETQSFTGRFAVARFGQDGTLDQTFGVGGWATAAIGPSSATGRSLALLSGGRMVVVGDANGDLALAVFLADGRLDESFGSDGTLLIEPEGNDGFGAARFENVLRQPDGKLLIVGHIPGDDMTKSSMKGQASRDKVVVRLNADGTRDQTFAGDGWLRVGANGDADAYDIAATAGGAILAGSSADSQNRRLSLGAVVAGVEDLIFADGFEVPN